MTLSMQQLQISYDRRAVIDGMTAEIPTGSFTAVIGPNGCGKSTLLRALARVISPTNGQVLLDGHSIDSLRTKDVARRIGLLPQTSIAPEGIRVADLVGRGRGPYQSLVHQWREDDETAVAQALEATKLTDLAGRLVEELSGGQRQRVWVAMLLAQQTSIMLLDEPTTFLDIAHQYDLMELFRSLHENGKTIVAVLHDLGQAARYADNLMVMHEGRLVAQGPPADVITEQLIDQVFGLRTMVVADPVTGTPSVVPLDPRTGLRSPQ